MPISDWAAWGRTRSTQALAPALAAVVRTAEDWAEAGVDQAAPVEAMASQVVEVAEAAEADGVAAAGEAVDAATGAAHSTVNSRISETGGQRSLLSPDRFPSI